jgi:hypothetical protein
MFSGRSGGNNSNTAQSRTRYVKPNAADLGLLPFDYSMLLYSYKYMIITYEFED